MISVYNSKQYTIGGIKFQVNFLSPFLCFDKFGGSLYFEHSDSNGNNDWVINVQIVESIKPSEWKVIFTGSDKFEDEMPYKWSIIQFNRYTGIHFEYENYPNLKAGIALIDEEKMTITISLVTYTQDTIQLDSFFHPVGIHILQYIAHLNKGFLIHASTVSYNNKGFLFSAVSGTGKSTMAELWTQCGASVINDDRLMVMPGAEAYIAYNTPMPLYQDICKEVKLHKTFLIKQSKTNYIKPLPVVQGTLGLLSNCMQYLYDENQVQQRLSTLHRIAETCGVYECGFKPDTAIVELIQKQFG